MFHRFSVPVRIGLGFAAILLLLAIVSLWSNRGLQEIGRGFARTLQLNELASELSQREVDHLNWAKKLDALLTDDAVTTLSVETDDHACAFGRWYYGEGRVAAEREVPELVESLKQIEAPHAELHRSAIDVAAHFRVADPALPGMLADRCIDHLHWKNRIYELFLLNRTKLDVELDPTRCRLGRFLDEARREKTFEDDPELLGKLNAIAGPHEELHRSAGEIARLWKPRREGLETLLRQRLDDHRRWALRLSESGLRLKVDPKLELSPERCGLGRFLHSDQLRRWTGDDGELDAAVRNCLPAHEALHRTASTMFEAIRLEDPAAVRSVYLEQVLPTLQDVTGRLLAIIDLEVSRSRLQQQARDALVSRTVPAFESTLSALDAFRATAEERLSGVRQASSIYATRTKTALAKVQTLLGTMLGHTKERVTHRNAAIVAESDDTRRGVIMASLLALVLGIVLASLIGRGIVRSLNLVIDGLRFGSAEITAAAAQVASASQQMAASASEQASNVEEISSSLEELASMTQQTAENGKETATIAGETQRSAREGAGAMGRMAQAIHDIQSASEQTSRIMKTIDEIAFQTNLLALNAAVEAARAGDAGKGFAVVAVEVRNLAQRSAEAAKSTAELLENARNSARGGVTEAENVQKHLASILSNVERSTQAVAEVSQATAEQSRGLDQINAAVSQMDAVTQNTASSSEESASASEELASQAQELEEMVRSLLILTGGRIDETTSKRMGGTPRKRPAEKLLLPPPKERSRPSASAISRSERSALPLDEDEEDEAFEGF